MIKPLPKKMDFKIKKLNKSNVSQLHRLLNIVFDSLADKYYPRALLKKYKQRYSKKYLQSKLSAENTIALGAYNKNELIGFIFGDYTIYHTFFLNWVGVQPAYRKSATFTALMRNLEKIVRLKKIYKIYGYTYIGNKKAVNIYQKMGYKVEGILKVHFDGADFYLLAKVFRKSKYLKK